MMYVFKIYQTSFEKKIYLELICNRDKKTNTLLAYFNGSFNFIHSLIKRVNILIGT